MKLIKKHINPFFVNLYYKIVRINMYPQTPSLGPKGGNSINDGNKTKEEVGQEEPTHHCKSIMSSESPVY